MRETVYFIQYRDKRPNSPFWSEWWCCSPNFATRAEAEWSFGQRTSWGQYPEQFRLVRGTFWQERVPIKTPLYFVAKRRLAVLRMMSFIPDERICV